MLGSSSIATLGDRVGEVGPYNKTTAWPYSLVLESLVAVMNILV